jgi:HAD superfamily hydrolase (TIGR01544 family)
MSTVIVDEALLRRKIEKVKADGSHSLHIISDFDKTFTRSKIDGEEGFSSWAKFNLSREYTEECLRHLNFYQPIEFDPHVSVEIKKPLMKEWVGKHLALLVRFGLTKAMIKKAVSNSSVYSRKDLDKLIALSHSHQIPFLIFSGGLGDVIREFLQEQKLLFSNLHIISNFFVFDSMGKVTGFQDDSIHSFNKSEVQLVNKTYVKEIIGRKNCILLGDSLGDVGMAQGLSHDVVIKIGFLNGDMKSLEAFKAVYDVVIVEDTGMEDVIKIVESILL